MYEGIDPVKVILDEETGETYAIYKAGKIQACYKLKSKLLLKETI